MAEDRQVTIKKITKSFEVNRAVKSIQIQSYANQAAATAAGVSAPAIFYSVADDAYYAVKSGGSFVMVA